MSEPFTFTVWGQARAQGSPHTRATKHGKTVVHEDKKLLDWRHRIADKAIEAGATMIEGPVSLYCTFWSVRPKSAKNRALPHVSPDLDKLLRAVGDALQGICYANDAQITTAYGFKRYGNQACAVIRVAEDRGEG